MNNEDDKYMLTTYLGGYKLVASEYYVNTVKVRRHRKKRINKKWTKKYGPKYIHVPKKELCIFKDPYGGDMLIGHPKYINMILEQARKNGGTAKDVCFYGQL